MNFDMYSNKQYNDDLDASYIYPRPYIDPMMYVNSSGMQMNPNTMGGYMTYMNPFMYNPFMYPNPIDSEEYDEEYNQDDYYHFVIGNCLYNNLSDIFCRLASLFASL